METHQKQQIPVPHHVDTQHRPQALQEMVTDTDTNHPGPQATSKVKTQNTQGQPLYIVVVSLQSQPANTHLQEQDTTLTPYPPVNVNSVTTSSPPLVT